MLFKDVVGHPEVKNRLRNMVQENRIPHAQLFFGNEGVGNLPMAVAFSRYILCSDRTPEDSCGVCPACLKINKLAHPDLHFVFPIASSKDVKVSTDLMTEFRETFLAQPYLNINDWFNELDAENKQPIIPAEESNEIIKKLSYTSYEGKGKIMIIWQPEKMNATAANKLLKMLEEPPDETMFFLVNNNMEQLLATILSRTQLVKFGPIDENDIAEKLIERFKLDTQNAHSLARLSEGNYREALFLVADTNQNVQNLQLFQNFMRAALKFDVFKINPWIDEMASLGREKQKLFLHYGIQIFRECLIHNFASADMIKLRGDELEFVKKFCNFVHQRNYERLVDDFNKAFYHIERNANPKVLFMDLALKTNELLNIPK